VTLKSAPFVKTVFVAAVQTTGGAKLVALCRTNPVALVGHEAVNIGTLFVVTVPVTGLVTMVTCTPNWLMLKLGGDIT
jgi:hypothetical protein